MVFSMGSATTVVCEMCDETVDNIEEVFPALTCRHLVHRHPDDINERTSQVKRGTCDQQYHVMSIDGAYELLSLSVVILSMHRFQSMTRK